MTAARAGLALLLSALLLATPASACAPPDCERTDHGTCVNACCKLHWTVPQAPHAAVLLIAAALAKGGPDGRFITVEGNAVQPYSSATSWVVQGVHTTPKRTYNDTLHLAAYTDTETGTTTLATFSHSQDFIKGNFAYGDYGQNYKNIVVLVESVFGAAVRKTEAWQEGWGCAPVNASTTGGEVGVGGTSSPLVASIAPAAVTPSSPSSVASAANKTYRPVVIMHGMMATNGDYNKNIKSLRAAYPGIYITSIGTNNGFSSLDVRDEKDEREREREMMMMIGERWSEGGVRGGWVRMAFVPAHRSTPR